MVRPATCWMEDETAQLPNPALTRARSSSYEQDPDTLIDFHKHIVLDF